MYNKFEVIIIGAGPSGLMLSIELALRNISCAIIEKRKSRLIETRAFGLMPLTLNLLDMRGLANSMISEGIICNYAPLGDGKGKLYFHSLKTKFPFLLSIPQEKTEEILEKRTIQLGVKIFNNYELLRFEEKNGDFLLFCKNKKEENIFISRYLIGCDGSYSSVRNLAKIPFTFLKQNKTLMHGDVYLKYPPKGKIFAKTSKRGMIAIFPHKNGSYRAIALDQKKMLIPVNTKLTLEDFSESLISLSGGYNFGINNFIWLKRFRVQQKQSQSYQKGKIFLLGDAAHTHMPAGGQGLQVAIHDAFNLGWKLAFYIKKKTSYNLLSSYTEERRKINEIAMKRSSMLFKYEIANDIFSMSLKWTINKLFSFKFMQKYFAKDMSGLSTNYHKIFSKKKNYKKFKCLGYFIRDIKIYTHDNTLRFLYSFLKQGKFVFISIIHQISFISWKNTDIIFLASDDIKKIYGVNCCLVRPDGIICWAGLDTKKFTKNIFYEIIFLKQE